MAIQKLWNNFKEVNSLPQNQKDPHSPRKKTSKKDLWDFDEEDEDDDFSEFDEDFDDSSFFI